MSRFKNRKYLFILALLILVAFCWYFYAAYSHMQDTFLKEKISHRDFDVALISAWVDHFVETDNDWGTYDYASNLSFVVSFMDATGGRGTYAELFDTGMNRLSVRSPLFVDTPFDPLDYPLLMEALNSAEQGELTVWFDKAEVPHDLHISYRWIPTDETLDHRLLILVGVSRFSVNTAIGDWIAYGAIALIIAAAIAIVGSLALLCRSDFNLRRADDIWKKRISSL